MQSKPSGWKLIEMAVIVAIECWALYQAINDAPFPPRMGWIVLVLVLSVRFGLEEIK